MLDTEYNEAEVKELFKEEGREEGIQEGIKISIENMLKNGKTPEEIANFCGYPLDQVQKVENEMLAPAE